MGRSSQHRLNNSNPPQQSDTDMPRRTRPPPPRWPALRVVTRRAHIGRPNGAAPRMSSCPDRPSWQRPPLPLPWLEQTPDAGPAPWQQASVRATPMPTCGTWPWTAWLPPLQAPLVASRIACPCPPPRRAACSHAGIPWPAGSTNRQFTRNPLSGLLGSSAAQASRRLRLSPRFPFPVTFP